MPDSERISKPGKIAVIRDLQQWTWPPHPVFGHPLPIQCGAGRGEGHYLRHTLAVISPLRFSANSAPLRYISAPEHSRPTLAPFPKPLFNLRDMPTPATPSQSAEDYLERIHELIEAKGYARVVDIASSLKVRQASVTNMVKKLGKAGYLKYEKYRGLVMTDQGREVARKIQNRHLTLSRFFSLFDLDAETQRADIEGIEHHLSPATLEMLADLTTFFEENPAVLRTFRQSRKRGARK
jgi:Mn-dependent DtxR family transcriptional regulator